MSGGQGYYESLQTVGNECTNALEKTMLYEHESPVETSQASQRAFAASLADTLGYQGALQICRDSGWDPLPRAAGVRPGEPMTSRAIGHDRKVRSGYSPGLGNQFHGRKI